MALIFLNEQFERCKTAGFCGGKCYAILLICYMIHTFGTGNAIYAFSLLNA
jgi:hypothetical protein